MERVLTGKDRIAIPENRVQMGRSSELKKQKVSQKSVRERRKGDSENLQTKRKDAVRSLQKEGLEVKRVKTKKRTKLETNQLN